MSFSLQPLFSYYLYLLSLRHVETTQGLPSHFVLTVGVLSLSTQSQFLSRLLPLLSLLKHVFDTGFPMARLPEGR